MKLKGRSAAITGGSSGIGLAIARAFRDEGARVAILGRDPARLEAARADLGEGCVAARGDVRRIEDLDRFFAQAAERLGPLGVVVANAGISIPRPLEKVDEEFFARLTGTNFGGVFFTVQRALPHLAPAASVILITSTIHRAGVPGQSVYAATKAAVRSLARSLAAELLPRGVRVNALSPGFIETPIFDRMGLSPEEKAAALAGAREQIPIGRFGRPEEVARAAVFLASGDASYVVGTELVVSGGLTEI